MTDELVRLQAERDAAVAALAEVRAALGVEGNGSVVLAVELLKRRLAQTEGEPPTVPRCVQAGRVLVAAELPAGCQPPAMTAKARPLPSDLFSSLWQAGRRLYRVAEASRYTAGPQGDEARAAQRIWEEVDKRADKWAALLEAVREVNRCAGAGFDSVHVAGVGTRRVDGGAE